MIQSQPFSAILEKECRRLAWQEAKPILWLFLIMPIVVCSFAHTTLKPGGVLSFLGYEEMVIGAEVATAIYILLMFWAVYTGHRRRAMRNLAQQKISTKN